MSGQFRSIALHACEGAPALEALLGLVAEPHPRFRDGERWTQLNDQVTLALASASELPHGAAASLNVKVPNVVAAHRALVELGVPTALEVTETEHEIRAAVWIAPHLALSVYSSR